MRASIGGAVVNHGVNDLTMVLGSDNSPISDNIYFANEYGCSWGTSGNAVATWDNTNEWWQLQLGAAEVRFRGAYSRAGAADTFYLNQLLPGVLTLTAGITQTAVALYGLSATAIANAVTATDLYTLYIEQPSGSGTVTRASALGIAGGAAVHFPRANFTNGTSETSIRFMLSATQFSALATTIDGNGNTGLQIRGQNGSTEMRFTSGGVIDVLHTLRLRENVEIGWAEIGTMVSAPVTGIDWSTAQTNDGPVWGLAAANMSLLFVSYTNRNNDYAAAAATNPTVYVYSATAAATATDEWISISHNVTDGVISVGSGNVLIGGTSGFAVGATAKVYFDGGGDTYIVEASADNLQFFTGGALRLTISTAQASFGAGIEIRVDDGTVGAPAYSWSADQNNGLYRIGTDNWAASAGGARALEFLHDGTYVQTMFAGLLNSGSANIKVIEESVTIAAGSGAAGVASAGNLIPAGSILLGLTVRVTQAPGGGATELNVSRTSLFGSNPDELIDAIATALNTTGRSWNDGDGSVTAPPITKTADTVTLSTNANVTGASMIVKVTVRYFDLTAATA